MNLFNLSQTWARGKGFVTKLFPVKEAAYIGLAVGLLFLGGQLSIPFYPVPLTLQPLVILSIGRLLPPGQAFLSVLSWITLGVVGAPVFAGFGAGPGVLLGPTGGYLVGMVITAPLVSFLSARLKASGLEHGGWALAVCLLGSLVTLTVGCSTLSWVMGNFSVAFEAGFLPFLAPELLKSCLAVWGINKLRARFF